MKIPVIGIVGGICSGKSTVAGIFGNLGCAVISADEIVHELLERKDVKRPIVEQFGNDILGKDGGIERVLLAERAFESREAIEKLNSIIHPLVFAQVEEMIKEIEAKHKAKAIVLDIPLLVETEWEGRCDRVVFVSCAEATRRERARFKGLREGQLRKRENFQISIDKKLDIADNIVDNNSGFEAVARQVAEILSEIAD